MSISKRLRYEILRRDNFACRYCGRHAPDVELTIDHVLPRILGGTDEAKNLVAACGECNSGKSSTTVDLPTVEDVPQASLRWAAARKQAIASVVADQRQFHDDYLSVYNQWADGCIATDGRRMQMDEGADEQIRGWLASGIPVELIYDAMFDVFDIRNVPAKARWREISLWMDERLRKIDTATVSLLDGEEATE